MARFLCFGALFLDYLLKLVQFLAQLCERMLCGIGFLSTFLGDIEIGFFHFVFLIPTTILCVVRGIPAPMFLAGVARLLGASFLGASGRRLSTRYVVSFLALVGSSLVRLCIRLFLGTSTFNSLKRYEKQMYVHGSHTFLVKVELVLPHMWAHPKNVTCQISLGKQYIHGNCTELCPWAVDQQGSCAM